MAASHDTEGYLARHLHDGWTDAKGNAEVLAGEIQPLAWSERLQSIDWFFWKLGAKLLCERAAEAVIDRRLVDMKREPEIAHFVETAEHTLAAVLMELDADPSHVDGAHQALTYALSPLAAHRNAADRWIAEHGLDRVARVLDLAPGHAFVLLARGYDDTALTLRARDAFWSTMLGREVGF